MQLAANTGRRSLHVARPVLAAGTDTSATTTKKKAATKPRKKAAPKKKTAAAAGPDAVGPDADGFYGRSVPYTSVHNSQLETFYDLHETMASKRLPQPVPK